MTPVDEFTYASAHYQAAIRTCQRTGPALEITKRPSRLLAFAGDLIGALSFLAIAFMVIGVLVGAG